MLENMFAFCVERRNANTTADSGSDSQKKRVSDMPRMRKCYGWITISGHDIFGQLPFKWWPPHLVLEKKRRLLTRDGVYTALVYEYVEEGDNSEALIENSPTFFREARFSHTRSSLARNWKQSVLIDISDIVYPGGFGWVY